MRPRWTFLLPLVLLAACTPEPRPLAFGHDACAHCRMTLSDPRYGAELVTPTGKTLPFDALECLAAYLKAHPEVEVHSLWTIDYERPETLVPLAEAQILHSPQLRSPMGANLTAFGPDADPAQITATYGGRLVTWDEAQRLAVAVHP